MDELKKAVELTRKERHSLREGDRSRKIVPFVRDINTPINYSTTHVLKINPKVLTKNRILIDGRDEAAKRAYKVLRTQVLQRMTSNKWNALAVTSPGPGEGTTVTAINLALNLAREVSHTVLLADLNLRKPRVHRYFGYLPKHGLVDHLFHDIPLSEILFNPQFDGLVILPGRESVENSSELLSSPRMRQMVEELRGRYPSRMLLFDLPPLLTGSDVLAFSPFIDAVLLVVEEGKTKREELERSLELLSKSNLLGTVLNKSTEIR